MGGVSNSLSAGSADTTVRGVPDGLFVKDYDGTLKVLSHGELKALDEFLKETESVSSGAVSGAPSVVGQALATVPASRALMPQDPHFREPLKSAQGSEKSSLHFHPDDQSDIQAELEKLTKVLGEDQNLKRYSVKKIAMKLAENHAIPVEGEIFKIFSRGILSFLRQLRNTVETKDALTKPSKEGGVGLGMETADTIVRIVRNLKDRIEEVDGVVVDDINGEPVVIQPSLAEHVPASNIETSVAQPVVARPEPDPVQPSPPQMPDVPVSAVAPVVEKIKIEPLIQSQPATPPPPPVIRQPEPALEPIKDADSLPRVQRRPAHEDTTLQVIQDVTRSNSSRAKLVGRVEELAGMDLATFRMLDANPRIRAGKILGKIQNLQSESFIRKSQGIDAWRGSETYKLYLELGQKSLESNRDMAQVIAETGASGMPTLTLEEFEAISDLNRALRF